jgi:hypothetical protein
LAGAVLHDEAGFQVIYRPGRREAALTELARLAEYDLAVFLEMLIEHER